MRKKYFYWCLFLFLLFFFNASVQASVPYFSSFLTNLDQFTSFGEVNLVNEGAKLSLQNSDFSALSPNFAPVDIHDHYSYQLQFSLENFQVGDQFEFRYLFLTNGNYHAFRCQIVNEQNFTCHLIAQSSTEKAALTTDNNYSSRLFSNNRRYTLKLYQNEYTFNVEIWPTDEPEIGRAHAWENYLYRYFSQENVFPPAIVLAKNLHGNDITQNTAALTLHQFQANDADFLLQLNVWPSYQTDENWRQQILGTTDQTATPQTIGEIGCALTSAAMIFNYYHYSFLPDGSPLDPAGLNSWLIHQPDGYINHNLLNWQALTRLSTQLHQKYWLDQARLFPKFEYRFVNPKNEDIWWQPSYLYSSLDAGQPLIAEIPGHFIVANGITMDNQIQIIDPYYPQVKTYDDLAAYNRKKIYNFRHFVPSYTDQSFIIINVIGRTAFSFAKDIGTKYYTVPLYELNSSSNSVLIGYQYLIPQPPAGQYKIILFAPNTPSQFQIFAYNHQGMVEFYPSYSAPVSSNGEIVSIDFDKNLDDNFAFFTDERHHHDHWFVFDKQISWPNQFIRLQFDYLINQEFFALADLYRLHYLERNIISYKLSEQLLNFWQNQL